MRDKELRERLKELGITEHLHYLGSGKVADKELRKALETLKIINISDDSVYARSSFALYMQDIKTLKMQMLGLMKHLGLEADNEPLIAVKKKKDS